VGRSTMPARRSSRPGTGCSSLPGCWVTWTVCAANWADDYFVQSSSRRAQRLGDGVDPDTALLHRDASVRRRAGNSRRSRSPRSRSGRPARGRRSSGGRAATAPPAPSRCAGRARTPRRGSSSRSRPVALGTSSSRRHLRHPRRPPGRPRPAPSRKPSRSRCRLGSARIWKMLLAGASISRGDRHTPVVVAHDGRLAVRVPHIRGRPT